MNKYQRGFNNYKEQSSNNVNYMSQEELLMTLYEELVKRITIADITLKKKDYKTFEDATQRCLRIFRYLNETLDRSVPISRDIARMYEYIIYSLGRIHIGRNQKLLDHIKPMVIELHDTFKQAAEECKKNKTGGTGEISGKA